VSELRPQQSERSAPSDELLPGFADLVVGISRLLVRLAALPPFRNARFTLADWVALSVLAKNPPKNSRQLANSLGVTRQRANQIKASLEQARLVSAVQSSEDARQKVLTVTNRGHAQLADINLQLQNVLASGLLGKERVLLRASKAVRILMRGLRTEGRPKRVEPDRKKKPRRRLTKMPRAGT